MSKLKRRLPMTVIAALSLVAAACGGGDDATQTQTDTATGTQTQTEAAGSFGEGPFGPGCSEVPTEGEGSVEGMTDDPVATAASNNPLLSTLVDAATQANLVDTLNNAEELTVFAPANSAFEAVPQDMMDQVMGDEDMLSSVLLYHVHQGDQYSAQELVDQGSITTLNEQAGPLEVTADGDTLTVQAAGSEAMVICGQVQTANATVYVIDSLLLPQEMGGGSETGTETEEMGTETEEMGTETEG